MLHASSAHGQQETGIAGTNSAVPEGVGGHDIIVIGASAGGLQALNELVDCLPRNLPAVCLAVLHIAHGRDSAIPSILNGRDTLAVKFAENGERMRHGALLLAPTGRHLVVERDRVRLSGGPRENFWRPSIDVLFRTAAVQHRSRVVGVVLSGSLDDGIAGLTAVRTCGGQALVQDPAEASCPEMPQAALRQVAGARAMTIPAMCEEITRLANTAAAAPPAIPPELELEARIVADESDFVASLGMPNELSLYNCPECGGPLAAQHDRPLRFRCTVGHAFTAASLEDGMRRQIDSSLWVAIRLLQQRSNLSRTLSEKERKKGRLHGARTYLTRAEEDGAHAEVLRQHLMRLNAGVEPAADR
jgi:two-component system, chemotaxis family, protein-glutamate methylesterase/glutaminase